jgi:hypothetical protein
VRGKPGRLEIVYDEVDEVWGLYNR